MIGPSRIYRRWRLATPAIACLLAVQPLTGLLRNSSLAACLRAPPDSSTNGASSLARPAAAAATATAKDSRHRRGVGNGDAAALFAAAIAPEEKEEGQEALDCCDESQRLLQQCNDGDRTTCNAEVAGQRRWQRARSWLVARMPGRRPHGDRPGLSQDRNPKLTTVAAGATVTAVERERSVGKVGDNGGGRRSWFRTRRWRRRGEKQHPDDTTTMQRKPVEGAIRIDVGAGRGTTIEAVHEEGPKIPQSSGTIQAIGKPSTAATAATAAVAAAAVRDDLAGVDKGEIVSDSDHRVGGPAVRGRDVAPRPAEYDGEEVLPETWAKVDELRLRAEKCDPEAGEEEKCLHLWLASGGGEGRKGLTDTDLLRFIMFRHGDVDAAWRQLKKAAAWRQRRGVEAVLTEEKWSRHKELQAEMFWIGRDAEGRPTMVLRSIAHHPGAIDSEDFQRYFLYLLEQGRQLWGLGSERQLNIIVDRIGAGIKNQDPRLLGTMLPVFRDAYPDIVYRCYVAPTSWIFRFVWVIAARLVDDRQRKRALLLVGDWKSRLLEDFDASVLPVHLGGTMKEYPPQQPPDM